MFYKQNDILHQQINVFCKDHPRLIQKHHYIYTGYKLIYNFLVVAYNMK